MTQEEKVQKLIHLTKKLILALDEMKLYIRKPGALIIDAIEEAKHLQKELEK